MQNNFDIIQRWTATTENIHFRRNKMFKREKETKEKRKHSASERMKTSLCGIDERTLSVVSILFSFFFIRSSSSAIFKWRYSSDVGRWAFCFTLVSSISAIVLSTCARTHTYTIHTSIVHCALIIQFPFHFMFRPCHFHATVGHSHADFCAFRHPHCPRNIHHNHNDSTRFHVNERMSGRYCDRTNATSAKVFSAHPVRIWDIFWMWTTGWRDKLMWRSFVHCAVSFVWFIGFRQQKHEINWPIYRVNESEQTQRRRLLAPLDAIQYKSKNCFDA